MIVPTPEHDSPPPFHPAVAFDTDTPLREQFPPTPPDCSSCAPADEEARVRAATAMAPPSCHAREHDRRVIKQQMIRALHRTFKAPLSSAPASPPRGLLMRTRAAKTLRIVTLRKTPLFWIACQVVGSALTSAPTKICTRQEKRTGRG